ncbi:MAG: hypothetical protein QM715_15260 [Nibricoccus sp.]
MDWQINPFQELYLSDSVNEEAFVDLFSPIPLTSAINPLFQEGNVVLSGTQGCGKSMILRLLFPETRIAFANKNQPFPVNARAARFVSGGIHLIKSGICDIGQVTLGKGDDFDVERLPFFFADFFNSLVVQDLLNNIVAISTRPEVFDNIVQIERSAEFAQKLAPQDCWLGALDGCDSLNSVLERLSFRIKAYRRWISNPDITIPDLLAATKTAIGEPIARTVECLKQSGVLKRDVKCFIRVDQLEELHQDASEHQQRVRIGFRQMLNRAFASRDLRLHYRIGTRRYGWNQPEYLQVHGSGAKLESRRDYLLVDLEDMLARRERRTGWTFPRFASDAFYRRIKWAYGGDVETDVKIFNRIFGRSPAPSNRAALLASSPPSQEQLNRVLRLTEAENWSPKWIEWFQHLTTKDPLLAVLAAAWGRQTGGRGKMPNRAKPPPLENSWLKKWWRKERLMQAVLQLTARRAQRLIWFGSDDVIALSAPNITVFLHLCHAVWDLFLKEQRLIDSESKRLNLIAEGSILPETRSLVSKMPVVNGTKNLVSNPEATFADDL